MNTSPTLLIGATQGTGVLIAQHLLQKQAPIRVAARNVAKAKERLGARAQIVQADLLQPETLQAAFKDVGNIVFTAGVTHLPASESLIRATEFDGVQRALELARRERASGRFLYMTSIGVRQPSVATWILNQTKGKTLYWRERAEEIIRASGVPYTIVRCGLLTNAPAGQHAISITQGNQPLTFSAKISRGDVATVCVAALGEPAAQHATFEIVWARKGEQPEWRQHLQQVQADTY